MRSADTNVLARLVAQDDAGQFAAAVQFVAGGTWVSLTVLAELNWVLATTLGRNPSQIAAAFAGLLDNSSLIIERAEVAKAALDCFRAHPAVGFADCLLLESARTAGHLPFGTFDRKLAKLPGAKLIE